MHRVVSLCIEFVDNSVLCICNIVNCVAGPLLLNSCLQNYFNPYIKIYVTETDINMYSPNKI